MAVGDDVDDDGVVDDDGDNDDNDDVDDDDGNHNAKVLRHWWY